MERDDRTTLPGSMADVYRSDDFVHAGFDARHRDGGSFGLELMHVRQPATELRDPATAAVSFVQCASARERGAFDFGDGWTQFDFRGRPLQVQPAFQTCDFRLPDLELRIACIDAGRLVRVLDERGLPPGALDEFAARPRAIPAAESLMRTLWQAADERDAAAALQIDGAFVQLLGQLLRGAGHGGRTEAAVPVLADRRLARVIDYVETHLCERLAVADLAPEADLSTFAFGRAFTKAVGETPHAYVMRRRLERAGELLRGTGLPLVQVAAACGFASQAHFTNRFRQRFAVTPGRYRTEARR